MVKNGQNILCVVNIINSKGKNLSFVINFKPNAGYNLSNGEL